jgi:hypothetical protein
MSFPRLTWLVLPVAFGLPLLTGGCGLPLAVTAASYGADGVSLAATKKTTTDHFASMVTREDCSFWRVFRHQKMCKPRETDKDPYQVNYDEPFRMQAEGSGVQYGAPLHAAPDAPAVSWDEAAYKPQPKQAPPANPAAPVTAIAQQPLAPPADTTTTTAMAAAPPASPPPQTAAAPAHPPKSKKKVVAARPKPKKAGPSQVASAH